MSSSKTGAKHVSATDPETDQSVDFSEGETVFANHNGRLYPAKVLVVEHSKEEQKYRLHYLGWNKKWDEWVYKDRLAKYNKENPRKQKLPNDKQGRENNPKSGPSMQARPNTPTGGKSKKRKVDSGIEENDTVSTGKHVKIQIPSALKKQLLDDCEFVTKLGKLVKLPRVPCIDDILKKYLDYKSNKDSTIPDFIGESLNGLRCYFDKALAVMLLYKQEVQQYNEAIESNEAIVDNISPSTVYGAEHLLRLFVKLPEILSSANIDEETLNQLLLSLHDFLKFLLKNQSTFFLSAYDSSINEEDG